MVRCLIRRPLMVSVAPGHRLQVKEHTMSNLYADPLFVKAEVDYRLERYRVGQGHRTASWPDLRRRLRHWLTERRHYGTPTRAALATGRPRHS